MEEDEAKSRIKSVLKLSSKFKVAFMQKAKCLNYVAISKLKNESITFLRRQLEVLHLQLISITTQSLIKTLQFNPSYDVITDISPYIDLIYN